MVGERQFIFVIFLAVEGTGTDFIQVTLGARNNRKLICIDLNDINSDVINSKKTLRTNNK